MPLVTEEIDPIADTRWLEFVERQPTASIFQHPQWLALLQRQYGYALSAWSVVEPSGAIVAGLPVASVESRLTGRRLVAIPFSDLCPPLVATQAREAQRTLVRIIEGAQARARLPLEIRAPVEGLSGAQTAGRFLHHWLDLTVTPEALARSIKPALRRGVAKARREGLVVERTVNRGALEEFFRLHVRTRRRQGVPTQPKRFILGLMDLFDRGLGCVFVVRHRHRPVAAAVFLMFNRGLIYKYGASDERFLNLRPNNLLFDEAIRWGVESGARELDFGRCDIENSGLAAFKRGWGCAEEVLVYTYLGAPAPTGEPRGAHVLEMIIRNSPAFAGRAIGELLYRHAG